jgi:hypothetical protein
MDGRAAQRRRAWFATSKRAGRDSQSARGGRSCARICGKQPAAVSRLDVGSLRSAGAVVLWIPRSTAHQGARDDQIGMGGGRRVLEDQLRPVVDVAAHLCQPVQPLARSSPITTPVRFGEWFVRTVDRIDIDHPQRAATACLSSRSIDWMVTYRVVVTSSISGSRRLGPAASPSATRKLAHDGDVAQDRMEAMIADVRAVAVQFLRLRAAIAGGRLRVGWS